MRNNTKVYGHCAAGCNWRVAHYDDMLSLATVFPVAEGEKALLEFGKRYKIEWEGKPANLPFRVSIIGWKNDGGELNIHEQPLSSDIDIMQFIFNNVTYDPYTPVVIRPVFFEKQSETSYMFRFDVNGTPLLSTGSYLSVPLSSFDAFYVCVEAETDPNESYTPQLKVYVYNDNGELQGKEGDTFVPAISNAGVLTWHKDDGNINPTPYYFNREIAEGLGWSRFRGETGNLINDNRWYRTSGEKVFVRVRGKNAAGQELIHNTAFTSTAFNGFITIKFIGYQIKQTGGAKISFNRWSDNVQYGYSTTYFTCWTDKTVAEITSVSFVGNDEYILYRNGAADGANGADGDVGATFTPAFNEYGVLTWQNDKGLTNPPDFDFKPVFSEIVENSVERQQTPTDKAASLKAGYEYKVYGTDKLYLHITAQDAGETYTAAVAVDITDGARFVLDTVEVWDEANVVFKYAVDGRQKEAVCSFDNAEQLCSVAQIYAEAPTGSTVYEPKQELHLTDTVTGKPYRVSIANGALVVEER